MGYQLTILNTLSILRGVHATPSRDDVETLADLNDEFETISNRIHEPVDKVKTQVQSSQSDIEGGQLVKYDPPEEDRSETESKLDVCEKCNAPSDIVSKFDESQRRLIEVTDEVKMFKIDRVERLKTQFPDQAAKIYEELCTLEMCSMDRYRLEGDEKAANESESKYLTYRYELADMLHKLARNEESLIIAKETWQRRAELDNFGTETKKSHQQYCLLLRSLRMFTEAKEEYRKVCSSKMEIDAEWAITSGFQLGLLFIEDGMRPEAGLKHWKIYEQGKVRLGLNTGLMIEIAEQVVRREEELELEGRANPGRMNDVLREVWAARGPNVSAKLLALGHKLGSRLYKSKVYDDASSVLQIVWTGQRSQLGENHAETLSSADCLFKSYFDSEKYREAVKVGEWILERRDITSKYDQEAISAVHSLGLAFMRLNRLSKAEVAFQEFWRRQKVNLGDDHTDALEAGRDYGDVLARLEKYSEAEDVFREVWERRKTVLGEYNLATLETGRDYGHTLERLQKTSQAEDVFTAVWENAKVRMDTTQRIESEQDILFSYGARLASILEGQASILEGQVSREKYKAAINVYRDLLDMRKDEPQSAETLRYMYRVGRCQYGRKHYKDAVKRLSDVWDQRELVWLEDSEDSMETGVYLCHAMIKSKMIGNIGYRRAKGIIDDVIEKASTKYGATSNRVAGYKKVKDALREAQ